MNDSLFTPLEQHLSEIARALPYPATPDLAGKARDRSEKRRRVRSLISPARLAGALLLLVLAVVLLNNTARAALLDFITIGVVRIFQTEATPGTPPGSTPSTPTRTPEAPPSGAAPSPTPTYLVSLLDLDGETSLAGARRQAGFPIRLPPDFGEPDHVFLQDMGGAMVVLVWMDNEVPSQAALSLHLLAPGGFGVEKSQPVILEDTTVKGQPAVWATGPYLLRLVGEDLDARRLIDGRVLIWVEGEITYRLETRLELDEAVRIAESLR